jgi:hypothetical protein
MDLIEPEHFYVMSEKRGNQQLKRILARNGSHLLRKADGLTAVPQATRKSRSSSFLARGQSRKNPDNFLIDIHPSPIRIKMLRFFNIILYQAARCPI